LKKILIITYYWPPSGGAGVQRWVKFAKYLPDFGIQPLVLTVDPEYASYPVIDESLLKEVSEKIKVFHTHSNEPFRFYKRISGSQEIPHSGFANQTQISFIEKFSRFIRGNFFIPDPRKGWNKYALAEARRLINENDISKVITTSPPHSTQLIGLELKNQFNIDWIADIRDPWTDIYYYDRLYHTTWAKRIDRKYELSVIQKADKVIIVSNAIKDQFLAKSDDLKGNKFSVIPNGYDEEDFKQEQPTESELFIITYTGTIAPNYNIEGFLNALKRLSEKETKFRLRFVGAISENFKKIINKASLDDITEYIDHVKHEDSINYLLKSSVLFLAIPHSKNNEGILTGKLFEYLASRKPIIAVGPIKGDASKIINECTAGQMFDYDDQDKIFDYLKTLYNQWKEGKTLVNSNQKIKSYSRKDLTGELVKLLIGQT